MLTLFTNLILFVTTVFAHGEIEIIECHNGSKNKVLRGEPVKKGEYEFKILDNASLKKKYNGVRLSLTDTVKGKQVIENIEFKLGKSPVLIKIIETPLREVREGSANLKLPFFKGRASCFAVY